MPRVPSLALLAVLLLYSFQGTWLAPAAHAAGTDVTPPMVTTAVAASFATTPGKTIALSTNKVDVTFSEAVDPVTSQAAGNYIYAGSPARTVTAAVLDVTQPQLVHLTLSATIGPNASFYTITVSNVQDLSGNAIAQDGTSNVGSFNIQALNFQCRLAQRLCSGQFAPTDSFFVEGNLAPLTLSVGDNGRLSDPNLDSVYTTTVPMSLPRDRVTGKAEGTLLWNFSHRPTPPTLEYGHSRSTNLTSDNGATATLSDSWADDPGQCLSPSMFSFSQLDIQQGASVANNTDVGEVRFDYTPQVARGYLNILARLPESLTPSWIIRNVFLPESALAAPVEKFAVRFPLSFLGVVDGDSVAALQYAFRLTGAPMVDTDTAQWYAGIGWLGPVLLNHPRVTQQGLAIDTTQVPQGPFSPGWFFPAYNTDADKPSSWIGCHMPNIDLDDSTHPGHDWDGCMPAACANSLKWLDDANVHIQLPDLRSVFDQLSNLMVRDFDGRPVTDSAAIVAKLDLIEAYKLPIKVHFQSAGQKADIKSTTGLSSADCRDKAPGWPRWGFLLAETADSEDVEVGGGFYYKEGGVWKTAGGHAIVVVASGTVDGKPWFAYKHDLDQARQDPTQTVEQENSPDTTGGSMHVSSLDGTAMVGNPPHKVKTKYFITSVVSESYDPSVVPPPDQHTFSQYCEEFRRTIPPHTKISITYPSTGLRCYNATINEESRDSDTLPEWDKYDVWNLNAGMTRDYQNNSDISVTIAVHNDDNNPFGEGPFTVNLAETPIPAPQEAPSGRANAGSRGRARPASLAGNPDAYGGFSLGGTSGGPDEFGAPPGPSVVVDASIGCKLSSVPGRMGAGVQQLTLTYPIPVWNMYWGHVGLHLTVSSVFTPGDLVVSCPSSGYSGILHVTGPGIYQADLGTVPQTAMFSITLSTAGGLDLAFDALGVPSLVPPVTGVSGGAVPRVARLRNLGPTPTSGLVTLQFDVPRRDRVELGVFNVAGRQVSRVVDGEFEAGRYERRWAAVDDAGRKLASGVYFCRMRTDGKALTARVVVGR